MGRGNRGSGLKVKNGLSCFPVKLRILWKELWVINVSIIFVSRSFSQKLKMCVKNSNIHDLFFIIFFSKVIDLGLGGIVSYFSSRWVVHDFKIQKKRSRL